MTCNECIFGHISFFSPWNVLIISKIIKITYSLRQMWGKDQYAMLFMVHSLGHFFIVWRMTKQCFSQNAFSLLTFW